jgi:hypothetical protein
MKAIVTFVGVDILAGPKSNMYQPVLQEQFPGRHIARPRVLEKTKNKACYLCVLTDHRNRYQCIKPIAENGHDGN